MNLSKGFIASHNTHQGDYVGNCSLYDTTTVTTVTTKLDTTYAIVNKTKYDSAVVIDTAVKVQILSWR